MLVKDGYFYNPKVTPHNVQIWDNEEIDYAAVVYPNIAFNGDCKIYFKIDELELNEISWYVLDYLSGVLVEYIIKSFINKDAIICLIIQSNSDEYKFDTANSIYHTNLRQDASQYNRYYSDIINGLDKNYISYDYQFHIILPVYTPTHFEIHIKFKEVVIKKLRFEIIYFRSSKDNEIDTILPVNYKIINSNSDNVNSRLKRLAYSKRLMEERDK